MGETDRQTDRQTTDAMTETESSHSVSVRAYQIHNKSTPNRTMFSTFSYCIGKCTMQAQAFGTIRVMVPILTEARAKQFHVPCESEVSMISRPVARNQVAMFTAMKRFYSFTEARRLVDPARDRIKLAAVTDAVAILGQTSKRLRFTQQLQSVANFST